MTTLLSRRVLARRIAPAVDAALQNEAVTRQRVEALESGLSYLAAVLSRGFWGRLRWLILGR